MFKFFRSLIFLCFFASFVPLVSAKTPRPFCQDSGVYSYAACVPADYEYKLNRYNIVLPWLSNLSKYCAAVVLVNPTARVGFNFGQVLNLSDKYNPVYGVLRSTLNGQEAIAWIIFYQGSMWHIESFAHYPEFDIFKTSGSSPDGVLSAFLSKILAAQNLKYTIANAAYLEAGQPELEVPLMASPSEFWKLYLSRVYSNIKVSIYQRSKLSVYRGHTVVKFNCPYLPIQYSQ